MASEDSERTEEPTARKLQKAREEGQIPRSKELTTALLGITAAAILLTFGEWLIDAFRELSTTQFTLSRTQIYDVSFMITSLVEALKVIALPFLPFIIALFVVGIASPILIGGWNFSTKAIGFKASKMSPAKGFKRMFGVQGLMELLKAIAKFLVVFTVATTILWMEFDRFLALGALNPEQGMAQGLSLVVFLFLLISASLVLIALIDVPFQIWNYNRQQKMTKQEVKDEMKDVEGRPEVKQRIRQQQMDMTAQRMMGNIPEADVVITNPEHYAVALRYDQQGHGAPVVLAKGIDIIAQQIKKVALANEVPIVEAPPLARALFYTTDLEREIPEELYIAVAQVLAYVYQLDQFKQGKAKRPKLHDDLPIPDSMQY